MAMNRVPTSKPRNMRRTLSKALPTSAVLTGRRLPAFRRALLRWYDEHRRDLPWRQTRDPYRIWLSEIMLQQTRVNAVLNHYRIFLERFPTVEALATAPEDAVLAAWSGLGYYRRARRLLQCAKEIVLLHRSLFPQRAEDLLKLPGVGRYTAAALASIAFDEPVAVVDGNVERVLRRLLGLPLTPLQTWPHAQSLLARSRPGDFNQAMMELGATVCLPREPRCAVCPVRRWCVTQPSPAVGRAITMERRASPPANSPRSSALRQVKKEIWCALSQRNSRVRLVQRSRKASLMPGMWELPQSSEPPRLSQAAAQGCTFRHSITVTDYTVHVLQNLPLASSAPGKWIGIERLSQIPITGLTRKILSASGII